mmetsp:Transcript_87299/g.245039  ORF Transcript_87299/g.245039 Transcript_87299/m.245039 type:complete len:389 (+) Transcript_87299:504-1670(+)
MLGTGGEGRAEPPLDAGGEVPTDAAEDAETGVVTPAVSAGDAVVEPEAAAETASGRAFDAEEPPLAPPALPVRRSGRFPPFVGPPRLEPPPGEAVLWRAPAPAPAPRALPLPPATLEPRPTPPRALPCRAAAGTAPGDEAYEDGMCPDPAPEAPASRGLSCGSGDGGGGAGVPCWSLCGFWAAAADEAIGGGRAAGAPPTPTPEPRRPPPWPRPAVPDAPRPPPRRGGERRFPRPAGGSPMVPGESAAAVGAARKAGELPALANIRGLAATAPARATNGGAGDSSACPRVLLAVPKPAPPLSSQVKRARDSQRGKTLWSCNKRGLATEGGDAIDGTSGARRARSKACWKYWALAARRQTSMRLGSAQRSKRVSSFPRHRNGPAPWCSS